MEDGMVLMFYCFVFNQSDNAEIRVRQSYENDAIDSKFGFNRVKDVSERVGWLLNMHPVSISILMHNVQFCMHMF